MAAAPLADELAVSYLNTPAHRDNGWASVHLHAFESVVVTVRMLRCRRENASIIWVVDNQIRVAPDGDGALAGKQPKQFRSAGARRVDKAVQVQPSALHAVS